MVPLAFLAVFWVSGCMVPIVRAGQGGVPTESLVQIDPAVWVPASRIAWPDPSDRVVHVFYDARSAVDGLSLPPSELRRLRSEVDGIRMGQAGSVLAVLFQKPEFVADHEVRRFIALHESFHLAAQFYGGSVGFDRLDGGGAPEDPLKVGSYWQAILRAVMEPDAVIARLHCPLIRARFLALNENDRRFVVNRAFWEWPAEYYARRLTGGYEAPGRYRAIRTRISRGANLYVIGSLAMGFVARIHGSDYRWQDRIAEGESALNVVLESMGCMPVADHPGGSVTVDRIDFIAAD